MRRDEATAVQQCHTGETTRGLQHAGDIVLADLRRPGVVVKGGVGAREHADGEPVLAAVR